MVENLISLGVSKTQFKNFFTINFCRQKQKHFCNRAIATTQAKDNKPERTQKWKSFGYRISSASFEILAFRDDFKWIAKEDWQNLFFFKIFSIARLIKSGKNFIDDLQLIRIKIRWNVKRFDEKLQYQIVQTKVGSEMRKTKHGISKHWLFDCDSDDRTKCFIGLKKRNRNGVTTI